MTTIRRPRPRPARDNAPQVVVAGAGFGGLAAVRALACAGMQVTLIDCNIYATFQPLLYQVATAGLADSDIAYPLRTITRRYGAVFRHGELAGIDPATRQVTLADRTTLGYDHLIVATGPPPPTTGIPGAAEHALGLYTRRDAIALRDRITAELDQISRTGDRSDVTVTVIGGGATGVELAGTLADLRDTILAALFPEIDPARIHITLLHRGPDLLAPFHPAYGSTPAASSPDATSRSGSAPHRPDRPRHGHPRRRHRPAQRDHRVGGRRGRPRGSPPAGAATGPRRPPAHRSGPAGHRAGRDLRRRRHRPDRRAAAAAAGPANGNARRCPDPPAGAGQGDGALRVPRQGHHGHHRIPLRGRPAPPPRPHPGHRRLAGLARAAPDHPAWRPQPHHHPGQSVLAVHDLAARRRPHRRRPAPRRADPAAQARRPPAGGAAGSDPAGSRTGPRLIHAPVQQHKERTAS